MSDTIILKEGIISFVVKKGKKERVIYTYSDSEEGVKLKRRAKMYGRLLDKKFKRSKYSHAYSKKRSAITNAKVHLKSDYFIKLDIEKFFNNINKYELARIIGDKIGDGNSWKILSASEHQKVDNYTLTKGLPLGLNLSPKLSDIYLTEFDNKLYSFLKNLFGPKYKVRYSRYADDLTISFRKKDLDLNSIKKLEFKLMSFIKATLKKIGLTINDEKTQRIDLSVSNNVKITGVFIVNEKDGKKKLSVGRAFRNKFYNSLLNNSKSTQSLWGMHSYITSIEKDFEKKYSNSMRERVRSMGFKSVTDLLKEKPRL